MRHKFPAKICLPSLMTQKERRMGEKIEEEKKGKREKKGEGKNKRRKKRKKKLKKGCRN